MKNIHVLPTDKPSNGYILGKCIKELSDVKIGQFTKTYYLMFDEEYFQPHNIYITSDEEIKEGDVVKIPCGVGKVKELNWKFGNNNPSYIVEDIFIYKLRYGQKEGELQINSFRYEDVKKIILTTDQDLIKDGVQEIEDEFLEWFVKNPSCEWVEVEIICGVCGVEGREDEIDVCGRSKECARGWISDKYKIIISKEEPKQETLTNDIDSHSWGFENFEVIKNEEDAKIFVETMENIPEPNDKLKKAFRDFNKQETLEEELLQQIKFCLICKNDSQAIRLIEKYGFEKQEGRYSQEDLKEAFKVNYTPFSATNIGDFDKDFNRWFEKFKNK